MLLILYADCSILMPNYFVAIIFATFPFCGFGTIILTPSLAVVVVDDDAPISIMLVS